MSRINEALRRLSLADPRGSGVGPLENSEANAEQSGLDRFVAESGSAVAFGPLTDSTGPRYDEVPVPVELPIGPGFEDLLDTVPAPAIERRAHHEPRTVGRRFQFGDEWEAKLVVSPRVSRAAVLQYRRLAGALAQWKRETGGKTLLVTSAREREGKTLTAVNLALTFSESFGRRVLLIDADQQRPSLHTVFSLPNTRGLTDALSSGHADVAVVEVSENLSVLSAGAPDSKSTAALTSYRMEHLLEQLAASVDWVLLDAGPVGSVPDAQRLSRITGAVLFVIRAKSTPDRKVTRALAQLPSEYVIGTVLNGVAATNDVPCVAR